MSTDDRYWYVVADDTPINPEQPLTADEAVALFLREVADDPDAKVDIEQCDRESLEWAGQPGRGWDEDDTDE